MKKIIKIEIVLLVMFFVCNGCKDEKICKDFTFLEMCVEWMLPVNDNVKLFVREFGKGDTVVVLHGGWGAEHSYLIEAFINISDKYHFVFYDQRGSLRSYCYDSLITLEKHIDDIEQIRKTIGLEKIILVGHSMGGFLAMSYLEKYSENVKGLILISSPPLNSSIYDLTTAINESAFKRWEREEVLDTLISNGLGYDTKRFSPQQLGMWHRITFAALNIKYIKNWRKMKGCFYYNQMAGEMSGLTTPEKWDFLKTIEKNNIPITIICGDDDYLPLSYHKKWEKLTDSNVELKIIENAGHVCWLDQPEIFETYILSALEKYKNDKLN